MILRLECLKLRRDDQLKVKEGSEGRVVATMHDPMTTMIFIITNHHHTQHSHYHMHLQCRFYIPGERGVEAEVGDRGDDHDEESPERSDRTLEDDWLWFC